MIGRDIFPTISSNNSKKNQKILNLIGHHANDSIHYQRMKEKNRLLLLNSHLIIPQGNQIKIKRGKYLFMEIMWVINEEGMREVKQHQT